MDRNIATDSLWEIVCPDQPLVARSALCGPQGLVGGNTAWVRWLSRLLSRGLPVPAGAIVMSRAFVLPLPLTCLLPQRRLARWLPGSHLTTHTQLALDIETLDVSVYWKILGPGRHSMY
ncbi:hypothetical protein SRHO_G00274950 [Serrasalmus rhombeus]